MEEARCCAILDEAIEELLTEVVKKEVKRFLLFYVPRNRPLFSG